MEERCYRTLFERTWDMLYDVEFFNNQSRKTVSTDVYLKNRSPTKLLKNITQYKVNNCRKPILSYLHKFRYIAYHHYENSPKKKLSNQGIKYKFFGYKSQSQYKLLGPIARKVIRSCHVI